MLTVAAWAPIAVVPFCPAVFLPYLPNASLSPHMFASLSPFPVPLPSRPRVCVVVWIGAVSLMAAPVVAFPLPTPSGFPPPAFSAVPPRARGLLSGCRVAAYFGVWSAPGPVARCRWPLSFVCVGLCVGLLPWPGVGTPCLVSLLVGRFAWRYYRLRPLSLPSAGLFPVSASPVFCIVLI